MLDEALSRLVSLRHGNPHSLLGAHPTADGGIVVRVLRPEAFRVEVEALGARHRLEPRSDHPGLFEGRLPGSTVPTYLVHVEYPGGASFSVRDPYAFLPTLGEQDLHFISEGTHRRLWERLGAHPTHHQGVFGTAFVVWAPNAEGVSVVGDFNGWDGRLNPMRSMGPSGLWELFVPDVNEGARYKYEIHPLDGAPFLKADPMAFRTEVPPLTASVVHQLHRYRWADSAWCLKKATGRSPGESSRRSSPSTSRASASPTSSCCRSPSTPTAAAGATRCRATTRRPRATATLTTSASSSTRCTSTASG
jgi:1,4-alpha-glucan branching enzyme